MSAASHSTADLQVRLEQIVSMMREMSRQTDPQEMVRNYAARVREVLPSDATVAISRRGLSSPHFRVTRYSGWSDNPDPWKQPSRLPQYDRGVFGELLYGDEPRLIGDLQLAPDDPAAKYVGGCRSLMALPLFDGGVSLNMVLVLRRGVNAFKFEELPERVWMSNLFGRATHNLVLSRELKDAYARVEREMQVVADIQQSLLPAELPRIPGLDLAAHYQTSQQAGGDYYDFFEMPDHRWGILIADVSGHGTPAAVIMAIMHSFAHAYCGTPASPGELMRYLNDRLMNRYTLKSGSFVTAFYGVYDAATRNLTYSCAGHPPPLIKRCDDGTMAELDAAGGVPLCIDEGETFDESTKQLHVSDQIIFYTDGITEAMNPASQLYGTDRLNAVLEACRPGAKALIDAVLDDVTAFTAGRPADDDRTLLVAKVR